MKFTRIAFLAFPILCLGVGCAATSEEDAVASAEAGITREECRTRPEDDAECRVEGVIEKVVVAEFDPYLVGDACVTFLRAGSTRYGIMRDEGACPEADRYEGAGVKAWFNKGALTLIARERGEVMKAFDANATYYDFNGVLHIDPLPTPEPANLTAFDALSPGAKVAALYDGAALRAGFSTTPIVIVETIPAGPERRAALDAYFALRDHSFQYGGGQPSVLAIRKGDETYAYAMSASGSYYSGSWGEYVVYDRKFEELTRFSYAE